MWNVFKKVTGFFKEEKSKTEEGKVNTNPEMPGSYEKTTENVGKKVFEKTGRIREGVGQSSTVSESSTTNERNTTEQKFKEQTDPAKTNQGIRKRKNVVGRNSGNKKAVEARKKTNSKIPQNNK